MRTHLVWRSGGIRLHRAGNSSLSLARPPILTDAANKPHGLTLSRRSHGNKIAPLCRTTCGCCSLVILRVDFTSAPVIRSQVIGLLRRSGVIANGSFRV